MDLRDVPISPASEAPPEVVAAFMRFVQQNPGMFIGKQVELGGLKPAPQHMFFRCPHCDTPVLSGMEACPNCQKAVTHTLKAGDVLAERYEIEDLVVKSGGFGNLYAVRDRRAPGLPLAMKQLQHRRQVSDKDRELFAREGHLLGLLHHRSLPRFHDAFTHEGAMYLVLQRIDGLTVGSLMRAQGALAEDQVLALLPQMLEVLSYLHHHEPAVLHRDVKPGNFMVTPEGQLFLIDFGAATEVVVRDRPRDAHGLPEQLTSVFTRGYTAPEVYLGGAAGPASDLFGLGATLLFMLTMRHPFLWYDAETARYRLDEVPVRPALRELLERLLAVPVQARYQDAEDVLRDLLAQDLIRPNPEYRA